MFSDIQEIALALSSTLDLDRILTLIMEKSTLLMGAERTTLFLIDKQKQEIWSKIIQGPEIQEIRLPLGEGLAGWVAQHGETINTDDPYQDHRFHYSIDKKSGFKTKSILCNPVFNSKQEIIGVIQVLNKKTGPFDKDDEKLLTTLSAHTAVSIENARLYQSAVSRNIELLDTKVKLEHKMYELDLLFEIEKEISTALNLEELLENIISNTMKLLTAEAGSILLKEHKSNSLFFFSALGKKKDELKKLTIEMGQGIVGWVAENKKPVIANQVEEDNRYTNTISKKIKFPTHSVISVPLMNNEQVLGAFEIINKLGSPSNKFTQDDLKILTLIASQVSKAIVANTIREEKQKANRLSTIGQMMSSILHDFKTPMTIISGYSQMMVKEDDIANRQTFSKQVLKQFKLMNSMIRDILAFSRGESQILLRKVLMNKFFPKMEACINGGVKDFNIDLEIDQSFNGTLLIDENKMLRVINNITRNAQQAMPDGGKFVVKIHQQDQQVLFSFTDSGTGIPEEIKDRLFDSFVTKGKKNGTGLGLAIVKKIVEEHKGDVSVQSEPDKGCTFCVKLPLG